MLSGSVLASCGAAAPTSNSEKGPVNLRYSLWDPNQQPAQQEIVNRFHASHPNIHITIENTPFTDYWTKMQTAGSAGTMPDILWMNLTNFLDYAGAGLVIPLDDYVQKSKFSYSNYPKLLVDMYTMGGKHYGLPKDFDTIGLWYNKKIFDQAGVKYPDQTWDWNTVHEAAKRLTDSSRGVWGIGAQLADQEGFFNTIFQNDGYVWNGKQSGFGTPNSIGGLEYWTDFISEGSSPSLAQMTDTNADTMFESGKLAMVYAGDWNTIAFAQTSVKDSIDVTVLPKGKKRAVVIHGLNFMIAKNSKYPDEAWEFIQYAVSKEAAQIQASTGSVLPAYNGMAEVWVKKYPQYNVQIYLDELSYSVMIPIRTKHAQAWANAETTDLSPAWQLKEPVAEAAKKMAATMDQDIHGSGVGS